MNTAKLLVERIGLFPSSGNIHIEVNNSTRVVERMQVLYADNSLDSDESCSGLSMVFADWRFKLQVSDALSVCLCVEIRVPHFGFADRVQEIHIKVIHILILLIEKEMAKA